MNHLEYIEAHVDRIEDKIRLPTKPLVSVVIVTYNHERFVEDSLEGALKQHTNFPFEVIVADDMSTDRTREILIQYQDQHPDKIRLRLATRNLYSEMPRYPRYGARCAARGAFVALCEGDDYWTDPKKLQKQVDLLEARRDLSFCFTATTFLEEGRVQSERKFSPPGERHTYELADLMRQNFVTTCTVVYRKSMLGEMPHFFWESPVGDWPLFVTLSHSGPIGYIDDITATRRIHELGEWSKLDELEKLECSINTWEPACKYLEPEYQRLCYDFLVRKKKKALIELLRRRMYTEASDIACAAVGNKLKSSERLRNMKDYFILGACSMTFGARISYLVGRALSRI